jgi:hypothetical protein
MIITIILLPDIIYLTSRILYLMTHFVDLAAEIYKPYSLRTAL